MAAAYQNTPLLELPLKKSYHSLIIDVTIDPVIIKPGTIDDLRDWDALPNEDIRIGPIQWRPNAIREKYYKKAKNLMYDARAKCHNLHKKYDKLGDTESRMLQQEKWDEYYRIIDQRAEIIDEEYAIMSTTRKTCNGYYAKMDEELVHQEHVFDELIKLYFKLVGRNPEQPTNKTVLENK